MELGPCEDQPETGITYKEYQLRAFNSLPAPGGVLIVDGSRKPSPITMRLASEPYDVSERAGLQGSTPVVRRRFPRGLSADDRVRWCRCDVLGDFVGVQGWFAWAGVSSTIGDSGRAIGTIPGGKSICNIGVIGWATTESPPLPEFSGGTGSGRLDRCS